ncbi:MAG: DUF4857 domain-containing protein [Campylobacterales bacterium]|nr:DUF4857 domain-containing protein [Campylobacterales bacterium]
MRVSLPKLAVFFLVIVVLAWFIPNVYNRATRVDRFSLSGDFSPLLKSFIIWENGPDEMLFKTEKGERIDKAEAHKNMPFIFSSNVNKWGGFPLHVENQTFSYEEAKRNSQRMQLSPRYVFSKPLPLQILFENTPFGTQFPVPKDVVIFKEKGLEFITMSDGVVDEAKSLKFTKALKDAGLVFPIVSVATNPTPLKSFDEGMMLVDANNALFHLKMLKNEPLVRTMQISLPEKPLYMTLEENPRKLYYGLIVTASKVYLYTYKQELIALPLFQFDPHKHAVVIRMSPLYQSIIQTDISDKNVPVKYVATNTHFEPLHVNEQSFPKNIVETLALNEKGLSFLTPLRLKQFSSFESGIVFDMRMAEDKLFMVIGMLFALLGYLCYTRLMYKVFNALSALLIALFGLPALVAIVLFGDVSKYAPHKGR